jgi:hypothetical protein
VCQDLGWDLDALLVEVVGQDLDRGQELGHGNRRAAMHTLGDELVPVLGR